MGGLEPLDEIGGAGEQDTPAASTRACPMAAAAWVLPVPLGPKHRMLPPCSIQGSPAPSEKSWALRMVGTAEKSKVAKVLPRGRPAATRWRAMRREAPSLSPSRFPPILKRQVEGAQATVSAGGLAYSLSCSQFGGHQVHMCGGTKKVRSLKRRL
jgi:hypothetical protein